MTSLRISLVVFTLIIFAVTIVVVAGHGILRPITFFSDLIALNWRSQFNADLLMHLFLMGCWIGWREGFGLKGCTFWFLSPLLGGMFTFPYVLVISYQARGNMSEILLGVNLKNNKEAVNF